VIVFEQLAHDRPPHLAAPARDDDPHHGRTLMAACGGRQAGRACARARIPSRRLVPVAAVQRSHPPYPVRAQVPRSGHRYPARGTGTPFGAQAPRSGYRHPARGTGTPLGVQAPRSGYRHAVREQAPRSGCRHPVRGTGTATAHLHGCSRARPRRCSAHPPNRGRAGQLRAMLTQVAIARVLCDCARVGSSTALTAPKGSAHGSPTSA
jgi:hypothetical protein